MSLSETAAQFVDACDMGKGWEACKQWCADGATFACQADALAEIKTVQGYTEWAKGLLTPVPDAHYELKALAVDEARGTALAYSIFRGKQTGEGGPVPPTGKTVAADYVYAMQFEGGKIRHMTKIWNDVQSLRQLGWA